MEHKFIEIAADKYSIGHRKLVQGVGVNDADYMVTTKLDGKKVLCPYYIRWQDMLQRCYSKKFHERQPTYVGCSVCEEWLIFSNFKSWMIKQNWKGNELDKDIKYTGNKIYSPDTCLFVTSKINKLLIDSAATRGEYPLGVTFCKASKKFRSRCSADFNLNYLGLFDTPEQASEAYVKFKVKLILSTAEQQDQPIKGYLIRIAGEVNLTTGGIENVS